MISERSCDPEDWSNDTENCGNKLHFRIYQNICNNISQYCSFYCVFDQINAGLESINDVFQKHKKNLTEPKL